MKITILRENGFGEAMLGLSLSYNKHLTTMFDVAEKLAHKDGGHNKFLESMVVWMDITAPLYWWKQFDTYRVGMTKQSESTMHTMMNKLLQQTDFEYHIPKSYLLHLNKLIENKEFWQLINNLPCGFLQRREVCTNYKTLRTIYGQRRNHKLQEWEDFCDALMDDLEFGSWLT